MYEIKNLKNKLRAQYIEKRKAIPAGEKAELDSRLCERFMALVTYRYADALLLYAPKAQEIDVMPIAESALEAGRTVAFPRCRDLEDGTHHMDFHIVTSLDQLEIGSYGIREPRPELPVYDPAVCDTTKSVIIVPALSYDRMGYRLGYGGGYYDRFLSHFKGARVGFAYSRFVCQKLPRSRYDLPVDVLVTERRVTAIERTK